MILKGQIFDIAKTGLKYDPKIDYRFKLSYFVTSRTEWNETIKKSIDEGNQLYDDCYPDAENGGNVGPIGMVYAYIRHNYVYLYMMDSRGSYSPIAYTHSVIAGSMIQWMIFAGFEIVKDK